MNRIAAIEQIYQQHPEAFFVLSNGLTSREAAHFLPQPQSFYLLHAMGEALSVGVGLAATDPQRQVVVIDGDGNALMGMASWSLPIPENLSYYILVNGCYQTTGDQPLPPFGDWPPWSRVIRISMEKQQTPNPPAPEQIWQQTQQWLEATNQSAGD